MIIDTNDLSKTLQDSKGALKYDEDPSQYASPPPYVPNPSNSASSNPSSSNGLRPPSNELVPPHQIYPSSSSASLRPPGSSSSSRRHRQHLSGSGGGEGGGGGGGGRGGGVGAPLRQTKSHSNITSVSPSSPSSPSPLSFVRSPSRHASYPDFSPIFLIASGRFLDKGFPLVAPPCATRPHPFALHDVNQGDWLRFLEDMRRAATLTEKQVAMAGALPIISFVPVVNTLVAHAVKTHLRRKRADHVGQQVDTWNHHFFHPRKMEVILMQGQVRLSGLNDYPIPNLHEPQTVSFSLADVPGLGGLAGSSLSSGEGARRQSLGLGDDAGSGGGSTGGSSSKKGKGKLQRPTNSMADKDKTYRLFVVSTHK